MTITENNLSKSSSPYLLQHQDNPVHWQEWSDEVLELAKRENKCLLISIGYSACHWCHVMAHESFEDEQVAEIMNAHFINIKIDREERPDIDQIYMEAAQLLTGRGGWPLNAFALPDGKPFYAGTYFPKDNWITILKNIAQAYQEQPKTIINTAERLTEGIKNQDLFKAELSEATGEKATQNNLTKLDLENKYKSWYKHIDLKFGGLDKAPKFPMPCIWQSLLDYYAVSKDAQALDSIEIALTKMYEGGIYDWVGGGFSRYSVDEYWFAPHFEKMLYDNAQLISLYADAYKLTKNPKFKQCFEDTINFLNTDLEHERLGYFSALDADSEGKEGLFYTWTYSELETLLTTEELEIATQFFGLKRTGNWEDNLNILAQKESVSVLAEDFKLTEKEIKKLLENIKEKLQSKRTNRIKPGLDNKLLTSQNGMMVKALVKVYQATANMSYKKSALELMQVITEQATNSKGVLQRLIDKKNLRGFLDDYAFVIEALIYCYEITFDTNYLNQAELLVNYTLDNFYNEDSKYFYFTQKDTKLIARKVELSDNVIPSSNAIMGMNLWRLGHLKPQSNYKSIAEQMLYKMQPLFDQFSLYFATWHQLNLAVLNGQIEVAVTGPNAVEEAQQIQAHYLPYTIFYGGNTENLAQLEHKINKEKLQIFICQHQVCSSPLTDSKKSLKKLKSMF